MKKRSRKLTCLSRAYIDDDQKRVFRSMLHRNRESLAFLIKELGQCEIAPMKIKVDESQGIVSSRPYRYSPQKMDIIDEKGQAVDRDRCDRA